MKIRLKDIIQEIEMAQNESYTFWNRKTGAFFYISEDLMSISEQEDAWEKVEESDDYICLPTLRDRDDYRLMEKFSFDQPSPIRDKLLSALKGRGAFSRFKDRIWDLGVKDEWYAYEEEAYRNMALSWCKEHQVPYE